jgi:hypothetical protein
MYLIFWACSNAGQTSTSNRNPLRKVDIIDSRRQTTCPLSSQYELFIHACCAGAYPSLCVAGDSKESLATC